MSRQSDRRTFLKTVGLASAALSLGPGLSARQDKTSPVALDPDVMQEKQGLTLLGDRPVNMETPPHLLDDDITPSGRLFVRNNGLLPFYDDLDIENWTLKIDGEVENALELSLADLKGNFEVITRRMVIECGGNGRRFYSPGASGNQWTFGAVGCPEWTGVRLRDVLQAAGVRSSAVYTGHYGADVHLSGDPDKSPISRGVPIAKAMDEHSLIVWAMNGEDLPALHGYPLRLLIPGWPGSCSQKWLTRIWVRDREHDGPKMGGQSYRVPAYPVAPGTSVPDEDMKIIENMPVKSLITFPKTGTKIQKDDKKIAVRGHAWAGEEDVAAVHISLDFGATWLEAKLAKPFNKYAWQRWQIELAVPDNAGYYEVWARATDTNGVMQPATTPGWNPKGYLNNMQHRIAVFVV